MQQRKNPFEPLVFGLILIFIFLPPLAPIAIIFFLIYKNSKRHNAGTDKSVEDRFGEASDRRRKDRGRVSTRQSTPHGHTPTTYSYDSCAREKRLEQLKVLKDAGLLDEAEYQQRRQELLAVR